MPDTALFEVDEAPREYVHERALAMVVNNLMPTPFLLLPFLLLTSTLLHDSISEARLGWWAISGVVATLLTFVALYRYYLKPDSHRTSRSTVVLVGMAFCAIGVVFGMSPWVSGGGEQPFERDKVLVFTVFPAVAAAVGCMVTAGRRDMFACFTLPVVGLGSAQLLLSSDTHLRGLGYLGLCFTFGLGVLHHVISRNAIESIGLQWRSEQLVRDLAHERGEMTAVNAQLAATNTRLGHQATHDPLTGLYNRRGTLELLEQIMPTASREHPIGLLFCDLDRFKAVNDALGHRGGDRFISIIADRLQRSLEPGSVAGRMGGDEFVVLMPGLDLAATAAVANRLVGALAQPVYAEGREMPSSVSIGVALGPDHGTTSSELLRHANTALYRAKSGGRNRVELFNNTMRDELLQRLEGEVALRRAVDDAQIVAFFQPEIDASTGTVEGAELLARWVKPNGVIVPATEFLHFAQSAALMDRITERVIASARPHMRRLTMLGLPDGFRFRVNLGSGQTEQRWREDSVASMLRDLDPRVITIDIHEQSVSGDLPGAAANLAAFRARGGRVCLDDFARGVSSLSLLRRLPLDEVRIDRLSIDTIGAHPHDRAIVRSIIALVREIGLAVTADGVETGAQADALIALGCVRQQGHLYAPALPAAEFEDYLLARMAERYANASSPATTWRTDDLAE
jgi:diguanylate cyclase (GGDEF)-like protein